MTAEALVEVTGLTKRGAVTGYAAGEPSPGVTDAVSGGRALVTVAAYALVFAVAAGAALRRRDVV